jgi:hypothetical protein
VTGPAERTVSELVEGVEVALRDACDVLSTCLPGYGPKLADAWERHDAALADLAARAERGERIEEAAQAIVRNKDLLGEFPQLEAALASSSDRQAEGETG